MKYAVISDIHANPAAFKTALADAEQQGCGRIVCLGDITGYGYDPKTCLDIVRRKAGFCLMGNHDSACVGLEPEWEVRANPNYAGDVRSRERLTPGDMAWLSGLPYVHAENGAAFTHGTFTRPEGWGYVISAFDASRNFGARAERVLFCGHTHHACLWAVNRDGDVADATPARLADFDVSEPESVVFGMDRDMRYLVNVGSVGYPRRDYCSVYVIWDSEAATVTFRRLPFDLAAYAKKLEECGVRRPLWLRDIIELMDMYPG